MSIVTDENGSVYYSDEEQVLDLRLSHTNAMAASDLAMNWYEKQSKYCLQKSMVLKQIWELAAEQNTSSLVEKEITDFLK